MKTWKDLKHYVEYKVDNYKKEAAEIYLMFDRFTVKRPKNCTCPAKSLAIFAHN